MGNCCLPFTGNYNDGIYSDSEEDAMQSLPLRNDVQAGTSLPTYTSFPKYMPNKRNQRKRLGQYAFREYNHPGFRRIFNASEAELVAAGWPSWMVRDAGEAFKGWIPREEKYFSRLQQIGEVTYSYNHVYPALDIERSKIVALKKIKLNNLEPENIRFMAREIDILRRLDHPNIIKLEGLVASRTSCNFYLVFEYMEHNLGWLASHSGLKFTEPQIKCYMKQLLCGLDYCHSQGILHRDINGSNLLLDNNGGLKIADFGVAIFYNQQQVQPLTNPVVSLWYRSPELLLGATSYGSAVDLWSAGCILAELYAGQPIFPGRTEVEQLHRIYKLCGSPSEDYWSLLQPPHAKIFKPQYPLRRRVAEFFKDLPAPALALIETLLSMDPSSRQSANHALNSEFFLSEPLPCKPEELPKYPPSKELNVVVQDGEARRQAAGGTTNSRAIPALKLNAELYLSMLKSKVQDNLDAKIPSTSSDQ